MCACVGAQSCLTLCDPMDCSLPGSSVHGISQARILEQVSSSRGSSQPRDGRHSSCTAGRFFTTEPHSALDIKCPLRVKTPQAENHHFRMTWCYHEPCFLITGASTVPSCKQVHTGFPPCAIKNLNSYSSLIFSLPKQLFFTMIPYTFAIYRRALNPQGYGY